MKKSFRSIISLTLTLALAAEPGAAAFAPLFSPPSARISLPPARFQEDALALYPLATLRFLFRPFTAFWPQLKKLPEGIRFSQSKIDRSRMDYKEGEDRVIADFHFQAFHWIDSALQVDTMHGTLPPDDRQILENVHEFLRTHTWWNIMKFRKFPMKHEDRIVASYRDKDGHKWIIVNPLAQKLLADTLAFNPDGDFIVAKLLIEEVMELMLEDPKQNPWTGDIDWDEPWVEAYIFRQEASLRQLWRRVTREKDFSRLRASMEQVFNKDWLSVYFKTFESLDNTTAAPVQGLMEEKHAENFSLFIPLLTLSYEDEYLRRPLESLGEKWAWATRRLRERVDRHRSLAILQSKPNGDPDSEDDSLVAFRYSQVPMKPDLPPADEKNLIKTVDYRETDTTHEFDVGVDQDQKGILLALSRIAAKHQANITGGTGLRPGAPGGTTHLVVQKDSGVDMGALWKDLQALEIPRLKPMPKGKMVRFSISVFLIDRPGAFHEFLKALTHAIPDHNIVNLTNDLQSSGGYRWMDIQEIAVPAKSKDYRGRSPEAVLRTLLDEMKSTTPPFITDYEITHADSSEATVDEIVKILGGAINVEEHRWLKRLFVIPQKLGWIGAADEGEITDFRRVLEAAQDIHAGQKRWSKGRPYHMTHLISVTLKLIRQGVRDIVILIASLLHDSMDPTLGLRKDIARWILKLFPGIKRRLLDALNFIANYKQGNHAEHTRDLTAKGTINLLALLLTHIEDNLVTIFEVDRGEHPEFDPAEQIADGIRFAFPVVTWYPGHIDNENARNVYDNTRRDFMATFIQQSEQLTDDEFIRPHLENTRSNTPKKAEIIANIDAYFKWAQKHTASLPNDPEGDWELRLVNFDERLHRLRDRLAGTAPNPTSDTDLDSSVKEAATLLVVSENPSDFLTKKWFGNTLLEGLFRFKITENDVDALKGEVIFSEKALSPIISKFSVSRSKYRASHEKKVWLDGPTFEVEDGGFDRVKPYFPELIRVTFRWLYHDQHFANEDMSIRHPNSKKSLPLIFDGMRAKADVCPYTFENDQGGDVLVVSNKDLDLVTPRPPRSIRGSFSILGIVGLSNIFLSIFIFPPLAFYFHIEHHTTSIIYSVTIMTALFVTTWGNPAIHPDLLIKQSA